MLHTRQAIVERWQLRALVRNRSASGRQAAWAQFCDVVDRVIGNAREVQIGVKRSRSNCSTQSVLPIEIHTCVSEFFGYRLPAQETPGN
jgi:hypothetical protein